MVLLAFIRNRQIKDIDISLLRIFIPVNTGFIIFCCVSRKKLNYSCLLITHYDKVVDISVVLIFNEIIILR